MARSTEAKLAPRPAQRPVKVPTPRPPRRWPPFIERIAQYLREVWVELNRVEWPSRREMVSMTIVVVIVLLAMSIYLGIFDWIYTGMVKRLLRLPPT